MFTVGLCLILYLLWKKGHRTVANTLWGKGHPAGDREPVYLTYCSFLGAQHWATKHLLNEWKERGKTARWDLMISTVCFVSFILVSHYNKPVRWVLLLSFRMTSGPCLPGDGSGVCLLS